MQTTGWNYSILMSTSETSVRANEWMDVMSKRLQQQWPSVDPARLDDVAADLWANEALRAMDPGSAADAWLSPVARPATGAGEPPATRLTFSDPMRRRA